MRSLPPLSEQIAFAEAELERALELGPKLIASGVQPAEAVERDILLQTAILASLKRQARAISAIPGDLDRALTAINAEVARIRTTLEREPLRLAGAA